MDQLLSYHGITTLDVAPIRDLASTKTMDLSEHWFVFALRCYYQEWFFAHCEAGSVMVMIMTALTVYSDLVVRYIKCFRKLIQKLPRR